MTEYGLILGLIVVVCLAAATAMGNEFNRFFTDVTTVINSVLGSVS